jgi:hypothetical protein
MFMANIAKYGKMRRKMGGKGSGNYYKSKSRLTTDDYHKIDLRRFKQRGWLSFGGWQTLTWSRGEQQTGAVNYKIHEDAFHLNYKSRGREKEWQTIDEIIPLVSTNCNFGGRRLWFNCPSCSKNVLIIYGGKYFRCRTCSNLVHPSSIESKLDRAGRALERYQDKLAPDYELTLMDGVDWLEKPLWMRHKTFDNLHTQAIVKQKKLAYLMVKSFGVSYF